MTGKRWRARMGMFGGMLGAMSAFAGEAPAESGPYLDLRYRYGNLHSDAKPKRGHANTVRAQLGYRWEIGDGWSVYGEGTRVWRLFGEQYDDTSGRRTPYPAEADPAATTLTNAWIGYRDGRIGFRVGRQYVRLDNGRFFSNNPWRQTQQSFDGANLAWTPRQGTELSYYWLGRVNRTVGADFPDRDQRRWKLNTHLLHVEQALPLGKLAAYGYFVRNDTRPANSVRTLGVRWTGTRTFAVDGGTLGWTAELARQHDYANQPVRFNLGYHLAEVSYGYKPLSAKLGEERLDGNGTTAFNVAYGAVRGFNGWVVAFRLPPQGLRERYAGVYGAIPGTPKLSWQVTYRRFTPVLAGPSLGNELDAGVLLDMGRGLSLEMQYGDYRAGSHGTDERKFWLIAQYRYGHQPK